MALNYSHRPIFPAHLPEDNIVQGGSQERDIRDILPADPFGMDISSTVTAITGWLEDLGADYGGSRGSEVGVAKGQYPIFAGWNFWWDTTMEFQPFLGHKRTYDTTFSGTSSFDGCGVKEDLVRPVDEVGVCCGCSATEGVFFGCDSRTCDTTFRDTSSFDGFAMKEESRCSVDERVRYGGCGMDEVIFGCDNATVHVDENVNAICGCSSASDFFIETAQEDENGVLADEEDGAPHPALSFALAYLGVRDLLSVEGVCKSLRFTVQNDPLLWKTIHIERPLSERVTDDVLLQLTNRAQGHLQCLSLVESQKVTDDGLRRVLENNLRLTKLSVPGCTRLSIDGVVSCLRAFRERAVTGIKYLRVAGLSDVTVEHFEELLSLLGIHNRVQARHHRPLFVYRGNSYLSFEDDRPIDIELCPRCQKYRLVFDCPSESCQVKDCSAQLCRACTLCIFRCVRCGTCLNDEYVEDFCLQLHCKPCYYSEHPDARGGCSMDGVFQQSASSVNGG